MKKSSKEYKIKLKSKHLVSIIKRYILQVIWNPLYLGHQGKDGDDFFKVYFNAFHYFFLYRSASSIKKTEKHADEIHVKSPPMSPTMGPEGYEAMSKPSTAELVDRKAQLSGLIDNISKELDRKNEFLEIDKRKGDPNPFSGSSYTWSSQFVTTNARAQGISKLVHSLYLHLYFKSLTFASFLFIIKNI